MIDRSRGGVRNRVPVVRWRRLPTSMWTGSDLECRSIRSTASRSGPAARRWAKSPTRTRPHGEVVGADAADHVRTSSPSMRPLITTGPASTAAAVAANASATESSPAPSRIDPQAHNTTGSPPLPHSTRQAPAAPSPEQRKLRESVRSGSTAPTRRPVRSLSKAIQFGGSSSARRAMALTWVVLSLRSLRRRCELRGIATLASSGCTLTTYSTTGPNPIQSPSSTVLSSILLPLTKVPFLLPRSFTVKVPPETVRTACLRETPAISSGTSHSPAAPRRCSPSLRS